jgi:hypothetical protein
MARRLLSFLISASILAACGPGGDEAPGHNRLSAWFEQPTQAMPADLSEFGLFRNPDNLKQVPRRALSYEPAYPLWSNGSLKFRQVVLPEGASIEAGEETWSFPVGTLLFKTFAYETDAGVTPVETRVLRQLDDHWEYSVYLWDDSGEDAAQLDLLRPIDVPVTLSDGTILVHEVPNKLQCRSCHEAGGGQVLGINARQFSDGVEPLAGAWHQEGHLSARPDEPTPLEGDELTRWVKGYALGNCVHCHNDGDAPNSSYSLYPADFIDNTVGHSTEGNASVAGTRVVAGDPESSVLFRSVRGDNDSSELKTMPPLGVQRRDEHALSKLRSWIEGLENTRD